MYIINKLTNRIEKIESATDYRRWDGSIVNEYYVFSTPTMFLLDKKREILLRPTSVKQMDAWVDWVIIKGNQN
jgi:hypothetical protein